MKKALITGGAGFIGYYLANNLLNKGYEIVLVDNFFRGKRDNDFLELLKKPNVTFIEADLTSFEEWKKFDTGYDHVYHLAAVNGTKLFYEMPVEVLRINILTSFNAIEWMRTYNKQGKILFTSSNELYAGAREAFGILPIPTPEDAPAVIPDISNPRWTYASTKIIGEQLFIHGAKQYGFRMSIVRPHNFYGPRAGYHHVIPELIIRALDKTDPFPIYGGQDKRAYCYITDAVEAMSMVMESSKTDGETYHIGSEEEAKATYLADIIFSKTGWKPNKIEIHESPKGSVKRRLADITKIKRDTGWQPWTKLEEGMNETIKWYTEYPGK